MQGVNAGMCLPLFCLGKCCVQTGSVLILFVAGWGRKVDMVQAFLQRFLHRMAFLVFEEARIHEYGELLAPWHVGFAGEVELINGKEFCVAFVVAQGGGYVYEVDFILFTQLAGGLVEGVDGFGNEVCVAGECEWGAGPIGDGENEDVFGNVAGQLDGTEQECFHLEGEFFYAATSGLVVGPDEEANEVVGA